MRMQELALLLVAVMVMAHRLEAGQHAVSNTRGIPQANSSSLQGDRVRRDVVCPTSEYRPTGKDYCCNECPAGFYKRSDCEGMNLRTECAECQPGTFTAYRNHVSRCRACQQCDSDPSHPPKLKPSRSNLPTCDSPAIPGLTS
ncbi:tumor necrosis factor receptor superfamily member 1A-like [Stegostoma tigrinum]|uniref:tumor necrosis factor receptor superfamily member 1A-like n=1 Tax=Stegostoma tigrinum TaxID=3053191 RepID=UPI002870A91C|nr:tumor necrosis factor receptor superfamily member 1A-like [Stegostoma tigrinum]